MAEFESFTVKCFDPDFLTLRWEVSGIPRGSAYTIDIYRSESPDGEWEKITDGITDREIYHDWSVNLHHNYRITYYKAICADSEGGSAESEVEHLSNPPDAEATDISRRTNLLLELYAGSPVFFLIRRSWGPRCPACYDPIEGKVTLSKCHTCYGTGYAGGFFEPILGYISNAVPTKQIQFKQLFENDLDRRTFWTGNYPMLKPKDIFVDSFNDRWIIQSIKVTQKMDSPLRQIFMATRLSKSDVLYDIEVPSYGDFVPKRDYHIWTKSEMIDLGDI